ncbi:HAD hydrolase family protein [Oerskovia sp. M15]
MASSSAWAGRACTTSARAWSWSPAALHRSPWATWSATCVLRCPAWRWPWSGSTARCSTRPSVTTSRCRRLARTGRAGPRRHRRQAPGPLRRRGAGEVLRAGPGAVGDRALLAYSGAVGLAELLPPDVTKAGALADWCSSHGIEAKDVWAFGDMPNDLPMLAWAGTSYAVGNAHAEVLDAATRVTASNDEDGVAVALEQLLDGSSTGLTGA